MTAARQQVSLTERCPQLTLRERQVCAAMMQGGTHKEIGRLIGISHRTVESHKTEIFRKLCVHSAVELCLFVVGNPEITS